jgi:hypothetical protein
VSHYLPRMSNTSTPSAKPPAQSSAPKPASDERKQLWTSVFSSAVRMGTKGADATLEADQALADFDKRFPST